MTTPTAAPSTALTVGPQLTNAVTEATDRMVGELAAVKNALASDLNPHELRLFALVCIQKGLDPFSGQIYAIKRDGKVTFQTGIDGYRSLAERTGQYRGSDLPRFGDIIEKPFPHPEWSEIDVYRVIDGEVRKQTARVWFDEFYPGEKQGFKWRQSPRHQLAKCAEALGLRIAFPNTFAGLYIGEEMEHVDAAEAAKVVSPAATPTERIAQRRAEIESQGGAAPVQGEQPPANAEASDSGTDASASTGATAAPPPAAAPPEQRQLNLAGADTAPAFASILRARAAEFRSDEPAESAQKAKLREILSQVGNDATDKVLRAAFGLAKRNEITAGQAAAILDLAAKDASFVARWKQAAE
jgi:phage recombination protein Bet